MMELDIKGLLLNRNNGVFEFHVYAKTFLIFLQIPMSTERISYNSEKCSTPSDTFLSIMKEIENEREPQIALKSSLSNHQDQEVEKCRKLVHFSDATNNE